MNKYTCPHCGSEDTKKTDTLISFIAAVVCFGIFFDTFSKHNWYFSTYFTMITTFVIGIAALLTGLKSKGKINILVKGVKKHL